MERQSVRGGGGGAWRLWAKEGDVQRCVCECVRDLGPRPKGVIFAGCSSLHCSNLLEMYYVTGPGHIHTERHTHSPDPHPLPPLLSERKFPLNLCLGSLSLWGTSFKRRAICLCRGKEQERQKPRGGENRQEGSVIVLVCGLSLQIRLCYLL